MPATVAPAKDIDAGLHDFAELNGVPPRFCLLKVFALMLAHFLAPII